MCFRSLHVLTWMFHTCKLRALFFPPPTQITNNPIMIKCQSFCTKQVHFLQATPSHVVAPASLCAQLQSFQKTPGTVRFPHCLATTEVSTCHVCYATLYTCAFMHSYYAVHVHIHARAHVHFYKVPSIGHFFTHAHT